MTNQAYKRLELESDSSLSNRENVKLFSGIVNWVAKDKNMIYLGRSLGGERFIDRRGESFLETHHRMGGNKKPYAKLISRDPEFFQDFQKRFPTMVPTYRNTREPQPIRFSNQKCQK